LQAIKIIAALLSWSRPSAFVGWDVEISGNKSWWNIQTFWQFRQFKMSNWSVE
jgi:hypothetical protein